MDDQLVTWASDRHGGASWFDLVRLDARGAAALRVARRRASGRIPEVHGKVVAELSFGFWRYLTARRYLTQLWIPALQHAFPGAPGTTAEDRRAFVEQHMDQLHFVRNRAAHHEPLHRRNLLGDQQAAETVASWTATCAEPWIQARSPLSGVVSRRQPQR